MQLWMKPRIRVGNWDVMLKMRRRERLGLMKVMLGECSIFFVTTLFFLGFKVVSRCVVMERKKKKRGRGEHRAPMPFSLEPPCSSMRGNHAENHHVLGALPLSACLPSLSPLMIIDGGVVPED